MLQSEKPYRATRASLRVAALAMAALATWLGAAGDARSQDGKQIVVGTTNELTGSTATVGRPFVAGANAYFKWINEQGGVNGSQIKFIALDDQANPDIGVANARQIIAENAIVLFQPVSSAVAAPLLPILAETGTVMISYTGVEQMYSNPNYFAVGLDTTTTLGIVAQYIKSVAKGTPRIAFLSVDTPASIGARDATIAVMKKNGWEIVETQTFPPSVTDFSPQIAKLAAAKPDYIVGTVVDGFLPQVVQGMRRAGIKAPLIDFQAGNAEGSFKTIASEQFLAVRDFLDPVEPNPAMEKVRKIAEKQGLAAEMTSSTFTKGWVTAAITIEALKKCGPGCTKEGIKKVLLTLSYDPDGLGPKIEFSDTHRVGASTGRIYRWDPEKKLATPVTPFLEALK